MIFFCILLSARLSFLVGEGVVTVEGEGGTPSTLEDLLKARCLFFRHWFQELDPARWRLEPHFPPLGHGSKSLICYLSNSSETETPD